MVTKVEDLKRPPRMFAKVPRLSRTAEIAPPHPPSSELTVGRTSCFPIILVNLKKVTKGPLGMQRMIAPHGMDTKPTASEMPHSRPPMRTTWNAAPPTNTIKTCKTISFVYKSAQTKKRGLPKNTYQAG